MGVTAFYSNKRPYMTAFNNNKRHAIKKGA
ncbi:hypothetical protein COLO4_33434 [Corchorus olitorius]|uniref:Uncharacterized protein n=1 Tax=Corchorus olitorius TaxID=93759 RepID=A0A1R3GTR8_9ROSI|nr:hypothetical protein COLO4_33434 [Corchorus olitorius]